MQGHHRPVIFHLNPFQHLRIGFTGTNLHQFGFQMLNGLLHFFFGIFYDQGKFFFHRSILGCANLQEFVHIHKAASYRDFRYGVSCCLKIFFYF